MFKSVNPGGKRTFAMAALVMLGLLLLMVSSASAGRVGGPRVEELTIRPGTELPRVVEFDGGYCMVKVLNASVQIEVYDTRSGNLMGDNNQGRAAAATWNAPRGGGRYRVVFSYPRNPHDPEQAPLKIKWRTN